MNAYKPRRCSSRWLDADCPAEVLAIIDHRSEPAGRCFDVIYAEMSEVQYEGSSRVERWLQGASFTERGASCDHFELQAHQVAAYRYRMKHRYAKWSTLPDAVKDAVKLDLGLCGECGKPAPMDGNGRPRDTVAGQAMCEACLADYLAENGVDR